VDVEDLIVALTFGQNTTPITVWIFRAAAAVRDEHDVIARPHSSR